MDSDDESEDAQAVFNWLALLCISPFDIILPQTRKAFLDCTTKKRCFQGYPQRIRRQMGEQCDRLGEQGVQKTSLHVQSRIPS